MGYNSVDVVNGGGWVEDALRINSITNFETQPSCHLTQRTKCSVTRHNFFRGSVR